MKPYHFLLMLLAASLLAACGGGGAEGTDSDSDSTSAEGELANPEDAGHTTGICIWDGIGIWAEHTPKLASWQANLAMGETVEILDQIEKEERGKPVTYLRVRQADTEKEGWVASHYVVPGGKAMAVSEDLDLYTRPALVAKANAQLEPFDVVAVTGEKDDWVRITGKRRSGKWIDKDRWIKKRGLTDKEQDLALATLVTRALKEKDYKKRLEKLKELMDNLDLAGGDLFPLLDALYTKIEETNAEEFIQPLDTSAVSGE